VERELSEAGIVPGEPAVRWADSTDLPDIDIDLGALDDLTDQPSGNAGP